MDHSRVHPCAGQCAPSGCKAFELHFGVPTLRLVGHGEMCTHPLEHQLTVPIDARRERDHIIGGDTNTMHAGVDLQMDTERPPTLFGDGFRERIDTNLGVHDRRERPSDDFGRGIRCRFGEHQDRRIDTSITQMHAFLHERHPERARAGFECGAGDGNRAVPICVGLDDRHQRGRGHEFAQHVDVVPDRAEIDLDPGGSVCAHELRARKRTRSPRATMPAGFPPSRMTTCVTSDSCISVAASSIDASGARLGNSDSIAPPTVAAMA